MASFQRPARDGNSDVEPKPVCSGLLQPVLWGKAERVGVVQPGEMRCQGDLTVAFQCLNRVYKKDGDRL